MNVIGVLSWYDESPATLAAAVSGFARVCDTIIGVDGAYALYPKARARSMPEQAEAVMAAAEAGGAGCVIHRPKDVWFGNEVEKRNHTFDLARTVGAEGEDWVLVFDADYQVMQAYPESVRAQLAETHLNVATYTLLDGQDHMADPERARLAQDIDISTEWATRTRGLFRLLPRLRYEVKHYNVVGDDPNGWPLTLFGSVDKEEQPLMLEGALVVYHRRQFRPKVRLQAADSYYKLRDELGVEKSPAEKVAA